MFFIKTSKKTKNFFLAFSLVELLVVIAIIGLLATLSVISLNNARMKSRDAIRVGAVKQMQTALEMFYDKAGRYPTELEFASGTIAYIGSSTSEVYLQNIPSNPSPRTDGGCPDSDYEYSVNAANSAYIISFCIGGEMTGIAQGINIATSQGVLDSTLQGLVGWWKFDEGFGQVAKDSSPNNIDAILASSTPPAWSAGVDSGNALDFSVADANVETVPTSIIPVSGTEQVVSISVWLHSSTNANKQTLLSDSTSENASTPFIWLYRAGNSDNLRYQFATGATIGESSCADFFGSGNNKWVHLAIVADYTNHIIKFYKNGYLFNTDTISGDMLFPDVNAKQYIGAHGGHSDFYKGKIDNLRIYDRELTEGEIMLLANSKK